MDFMKEIKEYLTDKIKNIGFDVPRERIDQIMEKVMSFADDPYCLGFLDERDRFIKTDNKIDEELNILIEEHNKKIEERNREKRERREKETISQKLDNIDDHLIELIKILEGRK